MFSAASFKQASFSPTSFVYDTYVPTVGAGIAVLGLLAKYGISGQWGIACLKA